LIFPSSSTRSGIEHTPMGVCVGRNPVGAENCVRTGQWASVSFALPRGRALPRTPETLPVGASCRAGTHPPHAFRTQSSTSVHRWTRHDDRPARVVERSLSGYCVSNGPARRPVLDTCPRLRPHSGAPRPLPPSAAGEPPGCRWRRSCRGRLTRRWQVAAAVSGRPSRLRGHVVGLGQAVGDFVHQVGGQPATQPVQASLRSARSGVAGCGWPTR
jgi:hypothetical protein